MGIKDSINKVFGGSKIRQGCEINKETGELFCSRSRINNDGSEESLAQMSFQLDGGCNPVATQQEEFSEGELDKLEKSVFPRIKGKCLNRPSDY